MTTSMQDLTTNADHSLSRLEMGSPLSPCDSNIKPLYPVRYAYVNFFGENLVKPETPPDIHTLMSATSLEESKGYAARLMRPGWIYIKEEGDMKHRPSGTSYFHIFKYDVPKDSGNNGESPRIERFKKFIYRNKKNARDGVEPEPGLRGEGYPFLFVSKDVSKISIAYSEHLWHPDVIARMDSDETLRQKTMQFINLDEDKQTHAIEATEANFTKLIQDYKIRKEQFAAAKAKIDTKNFEELDLESIRIDELTTQLSYEMDAENIAKEIRSKLCYQEKARIVILHDPVGRQKEILEAHDILEIWQQHNARLNLYPLTIGLYVDALIYSDKNPIKRRSIRDALNMGAVKKHWPSIKKENRAFEKRQDNFISLFKAFASDPTVTDQVGSLDNYFRHFFSVHEDKEMLQENDIQETYTFVGLISDIFNGLQMSIASEKMLEELISLAAEKPATLKNLLDTVAALSGGVYDPNKQANSKRDASIITATDKTSPQYSTNAWEIAATGMVKIITHSESEVIAPKLYQDSKDLIKKSKVFVNDPEKFVQKSKRWMDDNTLKIGIYVSDKFFELFGRILGKAVALMETGAIKLKGPLTHLSDAAIRLIANKIVPALLKPFGFVIDYRAGLPISSDHFQYILYRFDKMANNKARNSPGGKPQGMPKYHPVFKKLNRSQSLFDKNQQSVAALGNETEGFENAVKNAGNAAIKTGHRVSDQVKIAAKQTNMGIKLAVIRIKEGFNTSLDFLKIGTHNTAILMKKTAPGLSLFLNVNTATSVVIQSKFSQNNPLDQHSYSYDIVKFTTALISLTADLLLITSKVTKYAPKYLPKASPALLNRFEGVATTLNDALANKAVKISLGLVNIIGAYVSFIDGRKAESISNKGAAYSNYAVGLGSAALGTVSVGIAAGIDATVIGSVLIAGMAFMGWILIIGGIIGLIWFNRSDMQNLICNCFWGNGDKYPFWGNGDRRSFTTQLKQAREMNNKIQDAFHVENQEFLNLFFMPQLVIERKQVYNKFRSIYTFTLPAFQQGSSDLQYAFYQLLPEKPVNQWLSGSIAPGGLIQQHTELLKKEQKRYDELKSQAEYIDGKLYLYDEELTARFREALKRAESTSENDNLKLIITVEDRYPYPNQETAELFWHYIPFKDTAVPLRYLTNKKMNEKPIIGFKGTEFR